MLRHVYQLLGPPRIRLVHLNGLSSLDKKISALYVGNGNNLEFLRNLFFEKSEEHLLKEIASPLRLLRTLKKCPSDVDLVLSEVPPLWGFSTRKIGQLFIPAWIRQEIDLVAARQKYGSLLPPSLGKEVKRQIRRHGYSAKFTTDEVAKRDFFFDFYRPYLQSRFGTDAVIVSDDIFLERSRGHELARLYSGETCIAGLLLIRKRSTLRFGWFGARHDPPDPGASEVLDALCIYRAEEQGIKNIIMGHSRPCLTDGVVRYKKKFGARILGTRFPQPLLGISIRRPSLAVVNGLQQHPLVMIQNRQAVVYRVQNNDNMDLSICLEPIDWQ